MKKIPLAIIIICFFYSCNNHQKQSATSVPPVLDSALKLAAIDSFFPVTSFLKGQMFAFDSMPVTPLQVINKKGKVDSVWLKREDLKPLLQPFVKDEINRVNLLGFFKVTKFNDQTINAITFTYNPIKTLPDSIPIRQWNMYVNPETGTVSKIYIVKQLKENAQVYTQQLTWQTGKSAKITTILNKPDGNWEIVSDEKFIWDFQ